MAGGGGKKISESKGGGQTGVIDCPRENQRKVIWLLEKPGKSGEEGGGEKKDGRGSTSSLEMRSGKMQKPFSGPKSHRFAQRNKFPKGRGRSGEKKVEGGRKGGVQKEIHQGRVKGEKSKSDQQQKG